MLEPQEPLPSPYNERKRDFMEKKPTPRLRRRNAMRRPKRVDDMHVAEDMGKISDIVLDDEMDSGPSSTKSSPIPYTSLPSPELSSLDGDDTAFLELSRGGCEAVEYPEPSLIRRFSSYDRAVGYTTRRSHHFSRSKSVDDSSAAERDSPPRTKPRSPFRLPWKSRSKGKEKEERTPNGRESELSIPVGCLPAYKKSRSKQRRGVFASSWEFAEDPLLGESESKNGITIPKRSHKNDSLSRRMAMCFPAFLSSNADDPAGLPHSYSPPSINRGQSLHTDVDYSTSHDGPMHGYSLHSSSSEPNLDLAGEVCLDDTIAPDLEVITQTNSVLKMNVNHLVEEITLLDCEAWRSIRASELENCAWMKKDKHQLARNVMEMIDWFNRLALTVSTQVLGEETVSVRARVVSRFIQIAHKLWIARNFNSLKAVLAGLQCTPVFRLRKTWKEVSSKKRRLLRELSEIMSEDDNYNVYRHELAHALKGSHCVAFLGVFLTDVCQTMSYQQVKHQRQLSDGGPKISKIKQALKQHRRCVSSEVGANHQVHADSNPMDSYSQSLDHRDRESRFFAGNSQSMNAIQHVDSGVGSSDSVGSEIERRESFVGVQAEKNLQSRRLEVERRESFSGGQVEESLQTERLEVERRESADGQVEKILQNERLDLERREAFSGVKDGQSLERDGSKTKRRESFPCVQQVKETNEKVIRKNVDIPSRLNDFKRSPSAPVMSRQLTDGQINTSGQRSAIHVSTDWHFNNPLSDFELFQYGACLNVGEIWRQTERLAHSGSSLRTYSPSPVQEIPELELEDAESRQGSESSSDDDVSLSKQEIDEPFGPESPPILLTVPRATTQAQTNSNTAKLPERSPSIRLSKSLQRHGTTPVISSSVLMKAKLPKSVQDQLWSYQEKTMHFTFRSRESIRKFLSTVRYNSEEANYRLSLIREPRDVSKSTT